MNWILIILIQAAVMGLLSWILFKKQRRELEKPSKVTKRELNASELAELKTQRMRSLTMPLTELSRPMRMDDIVGQSTGIRALRAALTGPNPQHVIIYGPPGIGKTCAARLVLEEAKKNPCSPFDENSGFIEVDATCVRFDERSIADPLIGSVHDPIYQGAGAYGSLGVPQPKPGAVTRAHCGVLFLDEIGELHPIQMNKLLKVLEDRCVYFDSAYYSKDNANIPAYVHDVFKNGLPADFRLVGATTRAPEELPQALRSRCVEIFFRSLDKAELEEIVKGAAMRVGYEITENAVSCCAEYSSSGRDAINIIQLAGSTAYLDGRRLISEADINWVAKICRQEKRTPFMISDSQSVGVAYGLGVASDLSKGFLMEIECTAEKTGKGMGDMKMLGMIEQEEINVGNRRLIRKSTVKASIDNVMAAFLKRFNVDCGDYDIRFNIPGGMPVDGPSAGIAFATALMSAITKLPPRPHTALTGEITANGKVRPIGGVDAKLEAAKEAGARYAIIPAGNMDESKRNLAIEVTEADDICDVMRFMFDGLEGDGKNTEVIAARAWRAEIGTTD